MRTRKQHSLKSAICTHCGESTDVAERAMSIACPHCHKRLILEDYRITSYHAVTEFYTCGDIVVEKKGRVVAPIKANNLTVRGNVQGNVQALGSIMISKTGSMRGDIESQTLVVESGATLDCFCKIGPTRS